MDIKKCPTIYKNWKLAFPLFSYTFVHTFFLPLKYETLPYQAAVSFIVFSTSHFSVTIKTAFPLHL